MYMMSIIHKLILLLSESERKNKSLSNLTCKIYI